MIDAVESDVARQPGECVRAAAADPAPAAAPPLGEITSDIWNYFFAAALRGYPHETKERRYRNR